MFHYLPNRNHTYIKGFTLIELLVVIAIIGLLSSVVLASLSTARSRALRTQSIANLKGVVQAFELYATDHNGVYPYPATGDGCGGSRPHYCLGDSTIVSALVPKYLPEMPHDLKYANTINDYLYQPNASSNAKTYVMMMIDPNTSTYCWIQTGSLTVGHGWLSAFPACS